MQSSITTYRGRLFRNHLEARWAVFFDALKIRWEHQKKGFTLGSRGCRPDFWLSSFRCWVEIKDRSPTRNEISLAEALAAFTSNPVVIFSGMPGENSGRCFCADASESGSGGGEGWLDEVTWAVRNGGDPCLNSNDGTDGNYFDLNFGAFPGMESAGKCSGGELIDRAIEAARSARIEHGKNGSLFDEIVPNF